MMRTTSHRPYVPHHDEIHKLTTHTDDIGPDKISKIKYRTFALSTNCQKRGRAEMSHLTHSFQQSSHETYVHTHTFQNKLYNYV